MTPKPKNTLHKSELVNEIAFISIGIDVRIIPLRIGTIVLMPILGIITNKRK